MNETNHKFRAPLIPYRGYEIQVYKSNEYQNWGYKVFMTIGEHKKSIHDRLPFESSDVAMSKAKAYIDEFGEERMKRGFIYRGVRYYPVQDTTNQTEKDRPCQP